MGDEYGYDSDDDDEFVGMTDEEIIDRLCPFKFLHLYAHNWEGYRLLDVHMNDVWAFIEEARMKNMEIQRECRDDDNLSDMNAEDNYGSSSYGSDADEIVDDKPDKISVLVFCSKQDISLSRLNSEIGPNQAVDKRAIGDSICSILSTYKMQQSEIENRIWTQHMGIYEKYMDALHE